MAIPRFTAEASLSGNSNLYAYFEYSLGRESVIIPQLRRGNACYTCKRYSQNPLTRAIAQPFCNICCGPGYYWDPAFDQCMSRTGEDVIDVPSGRWTL